VARDWGQSASWLVQSGRGGFGDQAIGLGEAK
jgi:hypothetical protein